MKMTINRGAAIDAVVVSDNVRSDVPVAASVGMEGPSPRARVITVLVTPDFDREIPRATGLMKLIRRDVRGVRFSKGRAMYASQRLISFHFVSLNIF